MTETKKFDYVNEENVDAFLKERKGKSTLVDFGSADDSEDPNADPSMTVFEHEDGSEWALILEEPSESNEIEEPQMTVYKRTD